MLRDIDTKEITLTAPVFSIFAGSPDTWCNFVKMS